ncbi:MAG: hypothetical protein U0075_21730 [Thermomicrobiales bacterium]
MAIGVLGWNEVFQRDGNGVIEAPGLGWAEHGALSYGGDLE